jgi:hypothetical protein
MMELLSGRHIGLPLQVRLKVHFFSKKRNVLLPKHANRNPSGITCGYATLDLLLHALAKGVLLFFYYPFDSACFLATRAA